MMNDWDCGPDGYDPGGAAPYLQGGFPMWPMQLPGQDGGHDGYGLPQPQAAAAGRRRGGGKGQGKKGDQPRHPLVGLAEISDDPDQLPMGMQDHSILSQVMAKRNAKPPPSWANTTTVMMRNLPNKYTQRMLLTEVNQLGFLGTFDFLYLPIDPETTANRGYAFLNFIDPSFAWMFKLAYEGRKMSRFNSSKVVLVMPATLQGFDANYAHYSSARVNRGEPAARPLFLREPTQTSTKVTKRSLQKRGGRNIPESGGGNEQPSASAQSAGGPRPQQARLSDGDDAGPDPDASAAPQDDDGEAKPKVPKFCPQCGNAIQMHFQFCPCCGANVHFE